MLKLKEMLMGLFLTAVICVSAESDARERELAYLRTILPDSLLEYAHLEVASTASITISGEGAHKYLGLHVFPGQSKVNNGIRAELSVDYPFEQGETVRYSWRFMLPKDFVSDTPKNRWWLIGQWHDQPNQKKGESWQGFPAHSPPVAIGLGELDGRLAISLSYGSPRMRNFGAFTVERGKWHSIAVVIRWSQGSDGKAAVFLDDLTKPTIIAEGPNMHNDYRHYLKLGMYRHPDIDTDNWISIEGVQISKDARP
jgi:hypothetical protein